MRSRLKLNQNIQLVIFQVLIITLQIFTFCPIDFLCVADDVKNHSLSNTSDIPLSQIPKTLLNLNPPETISKKTATTNQLVENSYVFPSGDFFDGYNIFQLRDFSNQNYRYLITDMEGKLIKEFPCTNGYGYAHQINSTTFLLEGTGGPMYLWNIETGKNVSIPFSSHHDISYNPKTNTFMILTMTNVIYGADTYRYDVISEVNISGNIIWQLNTSSFIPFSWWSGDLISGKKDITHSNTVFWDIEDGVIYLNCKNLNTFFKIDHSTGQVVWGLGEYGNFTLFDQYGNQRQRLFYKAHAVEKVDKNTFILFDNSNNQHSRMVEITINETTMIANSSWVWTGTGEYYSAYWGDADRLPNGNRFGTFGTQTHIGTDIGPRLVEVNESGHVVWEMYYKGGSFGIYKAERFRLNPILNSPEDRVILNGEPFSLSWQTWYNFRTRLKANGSYLLYQNGQVIKIGNIIFNQYWLPTNLTFDISSLEPGKHNFTLIVFDEEGHETNDTIRITVTDTIVFREGPSQIELGQQNKTIQWTGASILPLTGELYNNNTLIDSFIWDSNGTNVELTLNPLTIGKHNISFQLFNDSGELYSSDTFWVTIYPPLPPRIISFPANRTISYENYSIFTWEIFDISPKEWSLLINNTLYQFEKWNQPHFQINWNRSVLEGAVYNLTLIITDQLGYQTASTTWITVIWQLLIIKTPQETIQWGQKNTMLVWEVNGGNSWTLWKNNTFSRSGVVSRKYIEIPIEEWQYEDWRLGTYNLTLRIIDNEVGSITSTVWIQVELSLGDVYANSVVNRAGFTDFTYFPNNSLASPDNIYSTIFVDYTYGYITLDMGMNEEIINAEGSDFEIIAQGGEYNVEVSNNLSQPFMVIGQGQGNQTFDLDTIGIPLVRYVRIECHSDDSIKLDSIVALNSNYIKDDSESPHVIGLEDLWIWPNQTSITLLWEVSDLTPWNYTILVNYQMIETNPWNGSDICFTFSFPPSNRGISVTLILYDIFGNRAKDIVIIEVREVITTTSTKASFSIMSIFLGLGIIITQRKRKKFKK